VHQNPAQKVDHRKSLQTIGQTLALL